MGVTLLLLLLLFVVHEPFHVSQPGSHHICNHNSGGSESPEPEDLQARALLPTHICSMLINDLIQELITQFACSDCCNGCLFHFEDEDGGKAPMGHRRRNGLGPCYKIFNYLMINIYTYIT